MTTRHFAIFDVQPGDVPEIGAVFVVTGAHEFTDELHGNGVLVDLEQMQSVAWGLGPAPAAEGTVTT